MALSYHDAEANRSKARDGHIIAEFEHEIDAKLNDAEWFTHWKCGTSESPFWRFTFSGNVSKHVLEEIVRRYKQAGWSHVMADNVIFENPAENSVTIELHMDLKAQ